MPEQGPRDDSGGKQAESREAEYQFLPIDTASEVVRWRLRLGVGSIPVIVIVVNEAAPVVLYLIGFATAIAVLAGGSVLGRLEYRIRVIRALRGRR